MRKGDSIRVFVELTSHQQYQNSPQLVEDNLLFTLEVGVQQKVNLKLTPGCCFMQKPSNRERYDDSVQPPCCCVWRNGC